MTPWARRLAWAPLTLLLLTACPADEPSAGPAQRRAALAWAEAAPPAALRAGIDLSAALPGVPASATSAVATPDGGADVVVVPDDPALPPRLVALDRTLAVVGSAPVTGLRRLWDVHLLPDGTVLMTGALVAGSGFAVVDPRGGAQRNVVVRPAVSGADDRAGGSVLSADGATVDLLVDGDAGPELLAVDVASGAVRATQELSGDVGAVSGSPLAPYASWLVPGSQGGVGLVFDAWPETSSAAVPALLQFGSELTPGPSSGPLTGLTGGGSIGAVVAGTNSTLFLTLSRKDGSWLLSFPPGADLATPLVRLEQSVYGYALAVDPWQGWAVTPAPGGVQAVNLVTGRSRRVDVGCAVDGTVRALAPGREATVVLAAGRCDEPARGTPMVWTVQL